MYSPTGSSTSQDAVEASFTLAASEVEELEQFAQERQTTTSEVVRSAIATQRHLASQPDGSTIWIRTPQGELRRFDSDVACASSTPVPAAMLARLRTDRVRGSSQSES